MPNSGSTLERRLAVADAANRILGKPVDPERVSGDTPQRVTPAGAPNDPAWVARLAASMDAHADAARLPYTECIRDPRCSWIETSVAATTDTETGNLMRATPRRNGGKNRLAADVAALTDRSETAWALPALPLAGLDKGDPDPTRHAVQNSAAVGGCPQADAISHSQEWSTGG